MRGCPSGRTVARCSSTRSPRCLSTCRRGCCGCSRPRSSTAWAPIASSTDVRVIAATNRCPLQAAQSGQLREDLLYRLAVFPVHMPPLRDRGNDIDLLAERFLEELNAQGATQKRFTALSRMTLRQHSWPGNVRELKNCIERAFIMGDQWVELAPLIQKPTPDKSASADDRDRLDIRVGSRIADMERSLIEATLE